MLALAGMSLAARADVILDTFNDRGSSFWPRSTTVTDPSAVATVAESASHVAGGKRLEGIGTSAMDVENFDAATVDINNSSGYSFLDYRSSVGAAATVELGYGQSSALNLAGANALKIAFLNYDLAQSGPLVISAAVAHGANTPVHYSINVAAPGAQTVTLPLTGFSSSLDTVVLDFVAPKGTDYRIDSISVAVPEPAALALLALGLPLLLKRRSRAA